MMAAACILVAVTMSSKENYAADTNPPCVVPASGMIISSNTILCGGTYYLNSLDDSAGVIILDSKKNITLEGDHTEIRGNLRGFGVSVRGVNKATIKNLILTNYTSAIDVDTSQDILLENITSGYSGDSAIKINSDDYNVTIQNCLLENYSNCGIEAWGDNNRILSNRVGFHRGSTAGTDPCGITIVETNSAIIENNFVHTSDKGIYLRSNCNNILVRNNTIVNSTLDTDGYDAGIFVYPEDRNIIIEGNTIIDAGSSGILLMKNNSNVTIRNNYIDVYDPFLVGKTRGRNENEPPAGIFVSEIYKQWLSDCSEKITDDVKKITNYKSHNVFIANNTFGSNVRVLLRVQGGDNITNDLNPNAYWSLKARFPAYLIDRDEFYMSNSYSSVIGYNGLEPDGPKIGLTDVFNQGYCDYESGSCKDMVAYTINKSGAFFKNLDSTKDYDVSLSFPKQVFYNIACTVSNEAVNITLPGGSGWYRTINMSVTPSSGTANVLVSLFNSSFVRWTMSWSGSNDVGHLICGLTDGFSYGLWVDGVDNRVVPSIGGCVDFTYSGTSTGRTFELYRSDEAPSGISVLPSSIAFSNPSPIESERVIVYSNVTNYGSVASQANVSCFDGPPSAKVLIGSGTLNLPAGSVVPVNFSWTAYPASSHAIYVSAVSITPAGNTSTAYRMVYVRSKPDLSINSSGITFTPSSVMQGASVMIKAGVRNDGETGVGYFIVRFMDGSSVIGEKVSAVGGAGNVSVNNVTWVPDSLGTHNITVILDPAGLINESSKANNVANRSVYVYPATTTTSSTTTTSPGTTTTSSTSTSTTLSSAKCWSAGNTYIFASGSQAIKFCRCVQGAYSHSDHHTLFGSRTAYRYTDTADNGNWTTSSGMVSSSYDRIKCSDGVWYHVNRDYYYQGTVCTLPGDYEPCGRVTLDEVISFINVWAAGDAALADVVKLIAQWAG